MKKLILVLALTIYSGSMISTAIAANNGATVVLNDDDKKKKKKAGDNMKIKLSKYITTLSFYHK